MLQKRVPSTVPLVNLGCKSTVSVHFCLIYFTQISMSCYYIALILIHISYFNISETGIHLGSAMYHNLVGFLSSLTVHQIMVGLTVF